MGITEALSGIKGKVLDAAHFELLKSAYDLQEKNIKQLQTSNVLLKEQVEHIKEENRGLRDANEHLEKIVQELQQRIKEYKHQASASNQLSKVAYAILNTYAESDETELQKDHISSMLEYTNIKVEAGISELVAAKLIRQTRTSSFNRSAAYGLTAAGKKCLVTDESH